MHVSGGGRKGRKKNMNFELNLIPFIDVLSVCICFLLVTAVFMNLGAFHVNQAVGTAKSDSQKPKGSLTVSMGSQGAIRIEVKDVKGLPSSQSLVNFSGVNGQVNFKMIGTWAESFAARFTDVKTVLLMPNPTTKYDDMIQLMAQFKKSSMDEIGVAPL